MFGISLPELLVIMAVLLIAVGPEKLPEVAKKVGKISGDIKRRTEAARREFYNSFYRPIAEAELKFKSSSRALASIVDEPELPPAAPTQPAVQVPEGPKLAAVATTPATSPDKPQDERS